jgi:DNA-binding MarR family transcriptional regulator
METSTGYLLVKLGGAAGGYFDQSLDSLGLRPRHVRVLDRIQSDALSQQDLCRLTGMDRTTMVAVLDDLERLGYARREPSPTDRRKHVVMPTDAGRSALKEAAVLLRKAEVAFLSPLSAAERKQLNALVARLAEAGLPVCET